jgi:alpha-beta hydrolase superfamily lysophospholipase
MSFALGLLKYLFVAALLLLAAVFIVRGWQAMRGPPLQPWHLHVPDEPTAGQIDNMDWGQWMRREQAIMADVRTNVTDKLPKSAQIPQNRYFAAAPMNPANLRQDWNRSLSRAPATPPRGAVVLLHGLTDAPYSLRHIADLYTARGWHVVAVRLPGHGTVPAGLTKASVEQWQAATRLAVREARRAAPGLPLHIAGYSNGGALAVGHALDATADPSLGRPDRLILVSPMIGLTPFARFTGIAGLPAIFPAFVQAAWLDIIPEYNPFKYNSFPVRAGAEAHRLTTVLGTKMELARAEGRLGRLPPVLGFQSAVDSTVSAPAVVTGLFDQLPANGSELVLFDINRAAYVGPLVRQSAQRAIDGLLPTSARPYRLSVITNAAPGSVDTVVRSFAPGGTGSTDTPLGIAYRRDFTSLGHVALPFPLSDGLYGAEPSPDDPQGVALGALAVRGENGVLSISPGALTRVSSNPFLPWMLGRIEAGLSPPLNATDAEPPLNAADAEPPPAAAGREPPPPAPATR